MVKFEEGDTVYHTKMKKFYSVIKIPIDKRNLFIYVTSGTTKCHLLKDNLILVEPNTPQNRLAIQIKYG